MGILGLFFVWYFIVGRNNNRVYRKIERKLPKLITFIIVASIFASIVPTLLGITIALFVLALIFGIPIAIFYSLLKGIFGSDEKEEVSQGTHVIRANNVTTSITRTSTESFSDKGLSKSVPKRTKIVKKFNKKYNLTLTDDEIQRIVDASYISNFWGSELLAMNQEYNSIHEWYSGDTGWFRVYIKAFAVQNISSDFMMQKSICIQTFEQIFREVETFNCSSIDECIREVNNRYLTMFDEAGFMIAYRFLQENGIKCNLPGPTILKNISEIEQLQQKYDNHEGTKVRLR